MQDFYTEKYKILLRHIKENLNKWGYIPCSNVGKFIASMELTFYIDRQKIINMLKKKILRKV